MGNRPRLTITGGKRAHWVGLHGGLHCYEAVYHLLSPLDQLGKRRKVLSRILRGEYDSRSANMYLFGGWKRVDYTLCLV